MVLLLGSGMEPQTAEKWRGSPHHAGRAFIVDGVIDESRWARAPRRVLFLLKEAYDSSKEQAGFDLRERLRTQKGWRRKATIRNLGRWAHLLHHFEPGDIPPFPSDDEADDAFLASALVNVKKSGGRSRSSEDDILEYARSDRALLLEQLEHICPDVIVLGGTWGPAKQLWPPLGQEPSEVMVSYRCHRTTLAPLINYWHPAAHGSKKLFYYGLAGIMQSGSSSDFLPARRAVEQL